MIKNAAHSFSTALCLITLITESVFVHVPSLGQSQNISFNPLTTLNVLVEPGAGVYSPVYVCVCV